MQKTKKKGGKLQQPTSSVAEPTEPPTDEDDVGKDFGTLINAPLSRGGHFVFKSEKAWTVDSPQYSEFFTLNLKMLSAAVDCVPFNKYVDVADRYFLVSTQEILEIQETPHNIQEYVKIDSTCMNGFQSNDRLIRRFAL